MARLRPFPLILVFAAGCAGSDIQGPPADQAVAVTLSEDLIRLALDDSHQLSAKRVNASGAALGGAIQWRSGNEKVAVVDAQGSVTAVGIGRTWIEASDTRRTDTAFVDTYVAFASIHAADDFTCGLTAAGTALCWGWNEFGALGDGSDQDSASPGLVRGRPRFSSFVAASGTACGLTLDALWCWGFNGVGQIGDATTSPRYAPTRVADTLRLSGITLGAGTTSCAFDRTVSGIDQPSVPGGPVADTSARNTLCWGWNGYNQLLDGGGVNARRPKRIAVGRPLYSVAPGGHHVCGLDLSGAAFCWGRGDSGQLGNGVTPTLAPPQPVSGGITFAALAPGILHTCGRSTSGQAWCWGDNSRGQTGSLGAGISTIPQLVAAGLTFQSVVSSAHHTCGLSSGEAWCWGDNSGGQLGRGTTGATGLPAPVSGTQRFRSISTGRNHTCAIDTDGIAWCWGRNQHGELGSGGTDQSSKPVRVALQR